MSSAEMLASIPLFDDLSREDIEDLAGHLRSTKFKANDVIFRKGDEGDSMYLVNDGIVSIHLPGEGAGRLALKEVHVGQYFGELSLFDTLPRSASATALTDCELLALDRATLHDHMKRRPGIALAVLAELAGRLRETNDLLSARAAKDVNKEVDAKLTLGERIADRVAEVAGSWAFILSFIGLLLLWVVVNSITVAKMLTGKEPFDPFPFIFFNLILSIVAALQGPVIMMSQNRQSMKDRAQAETDFKVNLKNEIGIEVLQRGLGEVKAHLALLEHSVRGSSQRPSHRAPDVPS